MTVARDDDGSPPRRIDSLEALHALYGEVSARSLAKVADHLTPHYRAFVDAAPFLIMATRNPDGVDLSPRGDPAGFVTVEDPRTLLLPDRRGNNRLDSLRNIVLDDRIALLFLIPGVGETLRVMGRAEILVDPALCERFAINGKAPTTVLRISVESVYFQCQKALARSGLWKPDSWPEARGGAPTAGEIIETMSKERFDGAAYDAGYAEYMKKTIY